MAEAISITYPIAKSMDTSYLVAQNQITIIASLSDLDPASHYTVDFTSTNGSIVWENTTGKDVEVVLNTAKTAGTTDPGFFFTYTGSTLTVGTTIAITATLKKDGTAVGTPATFTITTVDFGTGQNIKVTPIQLQFLSDAGFSSGAVIQMTVTVHDATDSPVANAEVVWGYSPGTLTGVKSWSSTSGTGTRAPIDGITLGNNFGYTITNSSGVASISITAVHACAITLEPYVFSASWNQPQQAVFVNTDSLTEKVFGADVYLSPDKYEYHQFGSNDAYVMHLNPNGTEFVVNINHYQFNTNDTYIVAMNNYPIAYGTASDIALPVTIGYEKLETPLTDEQYGSNQLPPSANLNTLVLYRQTDQTVDRSEPFSFYDYGTYAGNVPPYKNEQGGDLDRDLPQAQIVGAVRGILGTGALETGKLQVQINAGSAYASKTATVYLYMNGYHQDTWDVKQAGPHGAEKPHYTATVTLNSAGAGTATFDYPYVYGFAAAPHYADYQSSYADYSIGDEWSIYPIAYKTNTVNPD